MQPGESRDFSDNFSYSNVGTFDTLVTIDPNQIIPESNEANNSIAKQITVKKVPPKQAILRVWFEKVTIEDDADFWNNGEVNLFFNINGQKLKWYNNNAESGKTYNINKVSRVILNESENLKISTKGFDRDGDSEDSMGIVNKEFNSLNNWGKGNHNHRSSCPKGCYTIHYSIGVNWLD